MSPDPDPDARDSSTEEDEAGPIAGDVGSPIAGSAPTSNTASNPASRPRSWARWLIGAGALAGLAAMAARWPNINDVKTGATPEYPDIVPRRYAADADRVFLAAQEVGHAMPGWRIDDIDAGRRSYHAEAAVGLTPFTDDIWVEVSADGDETVVNVRSKSRVGRSDLGVNARRIQAFLAALDDRIRDRH